MSRESVLRAFNNLNRMTGGAHRTTVEAPHKPLLVMYALSQWLRRGEKLVRFCAIQEPLRETIRDFTQTPKVTVNNPFWRLREDEVFWEVTAADGQQISFTSEYPTENQLVSQGAVGCFTGAFGEELYSNVGLVLEVMGQMLQNCDGFKDRDINRLLSQLDIRPRW